ncbi:hypothetical protein CXG81DRAFT_24707 [Caulochytrium protostelioides]|uniref:J domain-containing protein n=1 Tax=Caulochytrium protostelioides TaxID=1555241 RepID=A0A4P9XBA1_9FUNG|nr:hypothetical protein CXG81DRAFT_24707 [Caulochytrium protostelioides]|eukprot:RKP02652.1 hypothetical protein CXG81DRAFT_24707 [Caulochytrium protostelioides]
MMLGHGRDLWSGARLMAAAATPSSPSRPPRLLRPEAPHHPRPCRLPHRPAPAVAGHTRRGYASWSRPRPPTHYETLGLDAAARPTAKDVKSAFYALSMQHHPDRAQGDAKAPALQRFLQIKDAYEVLSDPRRRGAYDRTVLSGVGETAPGASGYASHASSNFDAWSSPAGFPEEWSTPPGRGARAYATATDGADPRDTEPPTTWMDWVMPARDEYGHYRSERERADTLFFIAKVWCGILLLVAVPLSQFNDAAMNSELYRNYSAQAWETWSTPSAKLLRNQMRASAHASHPSGKLQAPIAVTASPASSTPNGVAS